MGFFDPTFTQGTKGGVQIGPIVVWPNSTGGRVMRVIALVFSYVVAVQIGWLLARNGVPCG